MSASTRDRAGAVVLVAAILATAATARLGFWQLDRARQKIDRQQALDARTVEPPVETAALAREGRDVDAQLFRRAVVRGRWLVDRTVWLDNRQMNGRVGFFVVTPLALDGRTDAVLVQRGFAPRRFDDRTALPPLATPGGTVEVAGTIAPPPGRLFEFAAAASGPIRQNLDLPTFARETGLLLLPLSIVEADRGDGGAAADGLARNWPKVVADVQMHRGYAFQWFALAATIVVLYVWFRIVAPRRRRHA